MRKAEYSESIDIAADAQFSKLARDPARFTFLKAAEDRFERSELSPTPLAGEHHKPLGHSATNLRMGEVLPPSELLRHSVFKTDPGLAWFPIQK